MFSAENLLKDSFFVVIVQIYLFINIIHTKTPNLIEAPVVHFCLTTYKLKNRMVMVVLGLLCSQSFSLVRYGSVTWQVPHADIA